MTVQRIEEHVVPGKRLGRHVDVRLRQLARPYAGPARRSPRHLGAEHPDP